MFDINKKYDWGTVLMIVSIAFNFGVSISNFVLFFQNGHPLSCIAGAVCLFFFIWSIKILLDYQELKKQHKEFEKELEEYDKMARERLAKLERRQNDKWAI